MILKSYLLENNENFFKFDSALIFGENFGLIKEFNDKIKSKYINDEILTYSQGEILEKQKSFLLEISSRSLFEKKKIFIINTCNDKIFNFIQEIAHLFKEQKLYLFSDKLEKKSKLRKFYENSKELASIPCYDDNEISLRKIIEKRLYRFKGLSSININLILDSCNNSRIKLINEIGKIEAYFLDKLVNTKDLIKLLNTKENDKFETLKNEAINGNKIKTNEMLNNTYLELDKNIFYLTTINQQLNKIKDCISIHKGGNIEYTVNKIKPPIFWKEKDIFINQLKKWNLKKINLAFKITYDLEIVLKSNVNLDKNILIKKTIIDICNLANAA